MLEILRALTNLSDTLRLGRGMEIGIKQKDGSRIVGVVEKVSHREGTVTITAEDTGERMTAAAKDATFIF